MTYKPALDNSEYGTTMDKDGTVVEARKFRIHPVLARVELRWTDPSNKLAKFYMRNGTVIEKGGAAIENLSTVPVAALVKMLAAESGAPKGDRPRVMKSPR